MYSETSVIGTPLGPLTVSCPVYEGVLILEGSNVYTHAHVRDVKWGRAKVIGPGGPWLHFGGIL